MVVATEGGGGSGDGDGGKRGGKGGKVYIGLAWVGVGRRGRGRREGKYPFNSL